MSRTLILAVVLGAVGPAAGQPKKGEGVSKEWVTQTAALPAAEQVKTVRAKLQELFGPHVKFTTAEIRDGAVVDVAVGGMMYVTDVGPLAAFKKLERLNISTGKVTDLAPLKGLPLKSLDCSANQIGSLDPVRGMPLEVLKCQGQTLRKTPDDWLAPAASLKGLKELHCSGVRVHPLNGSGLKLEVLSANSCVWPKAGIGVLRGMPLRELTAAAALSVDPAVMRGQPVAGAPGDVAPLKTLTALERLDLSENKALVTLDWAKPLVKLRSLAANKTGVAALDPLKGARALTRLSVFDSAVVSLEPLRGSKLEDLDIAATRVADLGPLEKVPLTRLTARQTRVRDLTPLKGLPLQYLQLAGSPVSDLSPLAAMKLTMVGVGGTAVKDLGPLRGMPVAYLDISQTAVIDLSPIRDMPINHLILGGAKADRFDVLLTLAKLEWVDCEPLPPAVATVLKQIKTLKTVNARPAAEALK